MSNFGSFYAGGTAAFARLFFIAYISQNLYDVYYKKMLHDELSNECTYYNMRNIAFVPQEPWTKTGEALVDRALPLPTNFDPRALKIPGPTVMF